MVYNIISGNPRRPPKKWWTETRGRVKQQYPTYSEERIDRITAGIWYGYSEKTRKRIAAREGK